MNWPRPFRSMPIARKLTSLMMITATVAILLASLAFVINDLIILRQDMISHQATLAKIIGTNTQAALDFNDPASARQTLSALNQRKDIIAAAIYGPQGHLFASYDSPAYPKARIPPRAQSSGNRFTLRRLDTFQPVMRQGQQLGTVFIRTTTAQWLDRIKDHLETLLLVLLGVGVISLYLSSILQRSVSKPILDLTRLAREVSLSKDFSLRASKISGDELGTLVDGFNQMIGEIQVRDERLKEHQDNLERQVKARTAALEDLTQRLDYQAKHDPLTGLPNRAMFEHCLEEAISRQGPCAGRLAVLFLDMERFKLVNDSLGHHMGDQLLQQMADRLRRCVRASDLIARQGGDEFTLLLPEIRDAGDATRVARKILEALHPSFRLAGHDLRLTASIGISLFPEHGMEPSVLMRNADVAMYSAKAEGGNDLRFFSSDMDLYASDRLGLEVALRRAIAQGELDVHYQPVVIAENGNLSYFEALVRWHHPEYGMVPPDRFIPLAEETGLIMEIDEWVLNRAARDLMSWRRSGYPRLKIAVNLSSREFSRPDLPKRLMEILAAAETDVSAVQIEITEGTLMQRLERIETTLGQLKRVGFQLAVDDFGTGYSSLSYLKRFPIDRLKVDKSFVTDLPNDSDNAAITRAIVAMAHNLNLAVTAEGVETREQLEYLRGLGCQAIQGYYFSKPLPREQVVEYLKTHRMEEVPLLPQNHH